MCKVEFLRSGTRGRVGGSRRNSTGDPGPVAGLDPSVPVALPAQAGNVGEGHQGAARVGGWPTTTFETPLPVLTF